MVLPLRKPPADHPTTMTFTPHPPKLVTCYRHLRHSNSNNLRGKDNYPILKDVSRRKSIRRTANKKQKTKSLEPILAHTRAKAAYGKPVSRISPTEFNQALRDRSLLEYHILAIFALTNSPPFPEKTNQKPPNYPSANNPWINPAPPLWSLPLVTFPPHQLYLSPHLKRKTYLVAFSPRLQHSHKQEKKKKKVTPSTMTLSPSPPTRSTTNPPLLQGALALEIFSPCLRFPSPPLTPHSLLLRATTKIPLYPPTNTTPLLKKK